MSALAKSYLRVAALYLMVIGALVVGQWPYFLGDYSKAPGELISREVVDKTCGKNRTKTRCLLLNVRYRYYVHGIEHFGETMRNGIDSYGYEEAEPLLSMDLQSGLGSLLVYYDTSDPRQSQLVNPEALSFEDFMILFSTIVFVFSLLFLWRRSLRG